MKRKVLWLLVPVLGLAALAMVVRGVSAQETVVRAPHAFSFGVGGTYLGVFIREVTDEDVERLDLEEERGALVAEMPDEGPAAEAGIREDDVIVSWNGSRIESAAQLRRMVRETPAGRTIDLGYMRDGRERTVAVELAGRSGSVSSVAPRDESRLRLDGLTERLRKLDVPRADGGNVRFFMRGGRLGVGIQNLGEQLAAYFGADDGGVLVTSVNEDSPAEQAGLRAGDVIVAVDGHDIDGPGDLLEQISAADEGEIEIRIVRDRSDRTIRANLPERPAGMRSGDRVLFGPQAMQFEFNIPEFHFELPEILIPEFDVHVEPSGRERSVKA